MSDARPGEVRVPFDEARLEAMRSVQKDAPKPSPQDHGLDHIRALYWAATEAKNAADEAMLKYIRAINAYKVEYGLSPEDELPLWPKKPPPTP